MSGEISRRKFIKIAGAGGMGLYSFGILGCGKKKEVGPRILRQNSMNDKIVVGNGDDIRAVVRAIIEKLGGMSSLVQKGDVVAVKPNIGWTTPPELAACTNPVVVVAVVELCREAGAKKVKVFDRSCRDDRIAYKNSGIAEAARKAGADVSYVDRRRFFEVPIEKGKKLKSWPVYGEALKADVLINLPVAKVHNATGLTLSLKNLMGTAGGDRGTWHQSLHQKIADYYTVLPCDLAILDAYRVMIRNGPAGGNPNDVKLVKTIAAGTDLVALDAFAAKEFFDKTPDEVRHIKYASEFGSGDMNFSNRVVRI
ncbi:DUF362 domain-containing protein [bacterium]|nr:DUF362 domain-containing protein [bacterium]